MAAHAARELGLSVSVISKKAKSPILGWQYLKTEIPGITGMADTVYHVKIGSPEEYSQKVYGKPDVPCFNWEGGEQPAWSMTEAYDNLWGVWGDLVRDRELEPEQIEGICERFDVVFNTLPRDQMCYKGDHRFEIQRIWVQQGYGLLHPEIKNMIVYSGRERDAWYRTSNIFGHHTTEYSDATFTPSKFTASRYLPGVKPLRHDCDCHDYPNMHRLGRFGVWGHGILVSHAYEQAKAILEEAVVWAR